ncbi:MAG: SPFH domain-containing protein [Deltaproteobacteria bacterium]|nr:SPFH domain-containing protein [Deltaproteobacteria bacterium]
MSNGAARDPRKERLIRRGIFFGAIGLAVLIGFNTTFEYVPPHQVGIKVSRFAGGIQQEPLAGGRWYITGPGVTIHLFPTTLQAVEFTSTASETAKGNEHVYPAGRIEIDTSDGSKMHADVAVLYRIGDAYKVMHEFGPGRTFEVNAMVPRAQAALKEKLGKLLAEDFYNEELREKATQAAMESMRPPLKESGLIVEYVLIRQYYYNQDYQKQIEQRKVQDQLVFTQQSRAEAAKEDARRRKIAAEGEASVAVEKQRGESDIQKIRAEADMQARKKRAEGDLLVTLATARGSELENAAIEGAGSDNLVAERMAEVLGGLDTIVLSDTGKAGSFNPLDLESLMKMFGRGGGAP